LTSRAEAREVLDVHAVEFSKTGPLRAAHEKGLRLTREALREVILVVSGFDRRALRCSRVDQLRAQPVQAADE
jgi:hypothetical protein